MSLSQGLLDFHHLEMSLNKLAEALPTTYHYLAASCFCLYNRPDGVVSVWQHAYGRLVNQTNGRGHPGGDPELLLARQFREAILRAGIFGGMSRAINVSGYPLA